jgi:hypothetical protein
MVIETLEIFIQMYGMLTYLPQETFSVSINLQLWREIDSSTSIIWYFLIMGLTLE